MNRMTGVKLSILALGLFAASPSFAHFIPRCGTGTSLQSLEYGIRAALMGGDERPKLNDEYCYEVGMNEGKRLAEENGRADCISGFKDGSVAGYNGDMEEIYDPSACSHEGYEFGKAKLANDARTGSAGASCLDAYQTGRSDGATATSTGSYSSNQDLACYLTGWDDGVAGL